MVRKVKAENAIMVRASNASAVKIPWPHGGVVAHRYAKVWEISLAAADAGLVAITPFRLSALV